MGYSPRGHKESDMTKHSKLKIPKVSAELELEPRPLPPKAQGSCSFIAHQLPAHPVSVGWGHAWPSTFSTPISPPLSRWEFRSRGGTFLDVSLLEEEKK